ncbi:MAG: SsrA-binding protein [Candidatus Margulisiibacteriota bacterium]|nr:MAG: SsrA-binding protein [Candidatus Margulisbacteria bacterium GWD2_39_127]OGI05312.1 MAG: SsrA-binding protein [Candidatus Margulisbacteria bacterium GWF2_38_17]OGI10829.1 MAG: SsrA-binding protein [Candidatus Margulisbacteria bacterium GWE2_39_32]PZM83515.1 MAG: SsrA-binding protein [Candidatus Margulisiibacteriota bacterium]HAR64308.1 SsrA-binding protein [Candidatus Margulisiibacteriota bacterium]
MNDKKTPYLITDNRKARFNYSIIETYEAGIVLSGTEVKSIRHHQVNLNDSFARVVNGEVWITNMHVNPYEQGNMFNPPPARERKLLLHSNEIRKLFGKIKEKGLTLIPLNLHWKGNKVKVDLALCKAKKLYDKREDMKKKDSDKEIERAIRGRG